MPLHSIHSCSAGARRRALALLASLLLVMGLGCAEERAAINRVQADALDKSFFVGSLEDRTDNPEFFMRTTVVDVAAGAGSDGLITNTDTEPTVRVRFEITEELLLARLAYELVDDSDHKGARPSPDGQIVAAYKIVKHFDIRRDYNPSTGEELNVIVENDTDRPWYERQYFRVDFSRNLITDAYDLDALSQLGIYYGVEWDPVAYYVNDPADPDAPVFDLAAGYFDITSKALAAPEIIEDEWWGDYPACWLVGAWPAISCNPSEITLRQSFLKAGARDYEPLEYDGARMEMFGYFTVDRFGYDRAYGIVDPRWHRFATRWDLYDKSHTEVACGPDGSAGTSQDVHRDDDQNGTEDACEAVGRGSRCDAATGLCTIPLRDRAVRTIPWHVSPGFPGELFEVSAEVLGDWSRAMRVAVLAGRLAECRRTGETDCEAQLGWPARWADDYAPPVGSASAAEVPEIFVLCHNPVDPSAGDVEACGPAGTAPRLGDLRYNLLTIVNDPQFLSPWGIMMDAEDPLTGEKIAGSVNLWGAVTDRYAMQLVDLLALLDGLLDPAAYINGQNVSDWVAANQPGGAAQRRYAMSAEEIARRRTSFDPAVLAPYLQGLGKLGPNAPPPLRHHQRAQALVDTGRLGPGNAALAARLRQLQGSPLEAAMVSGELAQAAGFDPTAPPSAEAIKRASPFGRGNPMVQRAQRRAALLGRAGRHGCRLEATEPDNLLGLVKLAQQRFGSPDPNDPAAVQSWREQVYAWARAEYTRGVFAHELGHAMGLRHNFAASFDALNYDAGYWQLRTDNGTITADCPDGTTDGSSCVAPRWRDPLSQAEIDGDIGRYATSSVMDYPGDTTQDQRSVGKYDRAALRLGYGGVVDVWNQPGVSIDGSGAGKEQAYLLTTFAASPGLTGIYWFTPSDPNAPYEFIHYSDYQRRFGLIGDCSPSSEPGAVAGMRCLEAPLDVVDYRDMQPFAAEPDYASFSWGSYAATVDPAGRVRRGYLFSSDEYADSGNVPAFTGDAGADAYEIVRFLEGQLENRYVLDAFRRGRVDFNSWDTSWRIQAKYLDKIQQIAKTFAFGALLDGDPAQPSSELLQDGYYGPLALSGSVALDMFARILTRPEPGYYCPADACYGVQPWGVDSEIYSADWAPLPDIYLYDFRVALGDGRYLHNDYDYSQGYWWDEYQSQVGTYYEKIWATYYLAEAFDYFLSSAKEDFTDGRYKNVSFATVYPEQVRRLYTSLLTGDWDVYAPWVVPPSNPNDTPLGTVSYPTWSDKAGLGPFPPGALVVDPNYAWNEQIYAMVWGALYFPTNWSMQWVHEARIAVLPSEQPDWPDSEIIAFFNPVTGLTYRAHSTGSEQLFGLDRQRSAGARMLEWANRLLTVAYLVQRDSQNEPILDAYGTPQLVLDTNGKPQLDPAHPGADQTLQRYVDNIDLFRQLTATFALPLGDLPDP